MQRKALHRGEDDTSRPVRDRLAARRLALSAAGLVALEAGIGALGGGFPALSAVVLLMAPGLALVPLLPNPITQSRIATLAAAPALGFAATSVALVSVASAGAPLTATVTRAVVASLVVVGFLAFRGGEPEGSSREGAALGAAGLFAAVLAGIVLQERVIGGSPVPGNDWAKYALYADEVRRHGRLLIDNPYWMLGVPFREEPGVPALYGAFLAMGGGPAASVAHGIWGFALAVVASTFAWVRMAWGPRAATLAAALVAVMPISHDILGWHGLANLAALALLPVALAYATALLRDGLAPATAAGFALVLVALAGSHRLTTLVAALAVALVAAIGLVGRERGRTGRGLAWTAGAAALLGGGVAADLIARSRTFGGTQSYTAYLATKVDLDLVARDLTFPLTAVAVAAVAFAASRWTKEPAVRVPLCLLAATAALAYAWVVHVPVAYFRMAYYLPVALAPLVAAAFVALPARRLAAAGAAALVVTVGVIAWPQADHVRQFYAFADRSSLRGLDAVAAELRPGEVVATDRCWSFLATWLLRTRVLPALEPADIQPKAEAAVAAQARALLDGTPAGLRRARELGVRYVLVDPTCTDTRGRPMAPPRVGEARYVSERLAVLAL